MLGPRRGVFCKIFLSYRFGEGREECTSVKFRVSPSLLMPPSYMCGYCHHFNKAMIIMWWWAPTYKALKGKLTEIRLSMAQGHDGYILPPGSEAVYLWFWIPVGNPPAGKGWWVISAMSCLWASHWHHLGWGPMGLWPNPARLFLQGWT